MAIRCHPRPRWSSGLAELTPPLDAPSASYFFEGIDALRDGHLTPPEPLSQSVGAVGAGGEGWVVMWWLLLEDGEGCWIFATL